LVLAIDVGTGSVRAALLDLRGRTVAFRARQHDQIVPSFGRAEQRPADWWAGAVASIRDVLDAVEGGAQRVVAVAACGQMHGTVLIDAALVRTAWKQHSRWQIGRTTELTSAHENGRTLQGSAL
jgi:xylulokinase